MKLSLRFGRSGAANAFRAIAISSLFALTAGGFLARAADPPSIVGDWEGAVDPGADHKKRIEIHITADQDGSLNGTIAYPDDNTSGIAITAITYKTNVLHFESTPDLSAYDGTMSEDRSKIAGKWTQHGTTLDLVLKRTP